MSQSGEEKEGKKRKTGEESKNQEQNKHEANVALSQATIREDVEERNEMTENVPDQHRCDECADTHTGKEAQKERPLKEGDERLRVDEVPPKLSTLLDYLILHCKFRSRDGASLVPSH
jgi:hypothetical protein